MKQNHHCEKIEAYHDGELCPEEMLQIAGHLTTCRECRETLAELKVLETMLAPARGADASALCPAVMIRVRAMQPQPRYGNLFSGWWKAPAIALASCAVYAICVEMGFLSAGSASLAATLESRKESEHVYSMIFGIRRPDNENLLALVLQGDNK